MRRAAPRWRRRARGWWRAGETGTKGGAGSVAWKGGCQNAPPRGRHRWDQRRVGPGARSASARLASRRASPRRVVPSLPARRHRRAPLPSARAGSRASSALGRRCVLARLRNARPQAVTTFEITLRNALLCVIAARDAANARPRWHSWRWAHRSRRVSPSKTRFDGLTRHTHRPEGRTHGQPIWNAPSPRGSAPAGSRSGGAPSRREWRPGLSLRRVGQPGRCRPGPHPGPSWARPTSARTRSSLSAQSSATTCRCGCIPSSGPRVKDHLQVRMLEALLRELITRWEPRLEVPVYRPVHGVIDIVLASGDGGDLVAGEGAQRALGRRRADPLGTPEDRRPAVGDGWPWGVGASRRASDSCCSVTRGQCAVLVAHAAAVFDAAYPASSAAAFEALVGDRPWPGDAVVWVRLDGSATHLLHAAPVSGLDSRTSYCHDRRMPDDPYSLNDLARLADVTPRTIRYYVAQGLLPSPEAAGPSTRYGEGHLARLRLIKRLQRDHLPLAEIRGRIERLGDDEVRGSWMRSRPSRNRWPRPRRSRSCGISWPSRASSRASPSHGPSTVGRRPRSSR